MRHPLRCVAAMALATGLLCAANLPAGAAGLRASSAVTLPQIVNPHPAMGDISLPMPCNLSMVLRPVEVPARDALGDLSFSMGNETGGHAGLDYYDRRFSASIAAPFTARDLPEAWRKALPEQTGVPLFWYFLGKYEVTEAQWQAVMDGVCPKEPFSESAARPKTGISWYDVQQFFKTYNQWLLQNADAALPRFADDTRNRGFARLPTEAEWEYAARGGSRVPRESLNQEPFPRLEEGATLRDYAVFRPADAATVQETPLSVGSRKANPLGLYDMAGNAAEMVQDSFRFSLGGRLHGSAGGFVRKGGGFASSETEILPGSREEVAFFNDRGPVAARDLGLRVALSGINTPGGPRPEALRAAWDKLGESAVVVREGETPLQEVDRLLAETHDPALKTNLTRLRGRLKDDNIALENQRSSVAENTVRTAIYMSETVRNYAVRYNIAHQRVQEITRLLAEARARKASTADITAFETARKQFEESCENQMQAMEAAVNFYKSKLEETAEFPAEMIDHKYKLVLHELDQDNLLARNMRRNLELFGKHLKQFREKRFDSLTRARLLRDIVPDNLQAGMKL